MSSPFREIIVALVIVRIVYWLGSAGKTGSSKLAESSASRLFHNILLYAAYLLAWPVRSANSLISMRFEPPIAVLEVIGVVLVALGVGLAIWARSVLGAYWSGRVTITQGHRLIRSGPYGIVRNPIYLGDVLTVLGMVLALGEIRGVLGLALIVTYAILKSRTEEHFLHEEFGEEFDAYQLAVKFLIPLIF